VLVNFSPCLSYIANNSSTPSSGCCSQLASVVSSQPQCLCEVLNRGYDRDSSKQPRSYPHITVVLASTAAVSFLQYHLKIIYVPITAVLARIAVVSSLQYHLKLFMCLPPWFWLQPRWYCCT